MQLRDYQRACVDSIYSYLRNKSGNPCAVLPTGSGKTPCLAQLCSDAVTAWNGRVLVLAHVKELLEQSHRTLSELCPTVRVGLYSAGLNSRQTQESVIVAGIQSVHDKAEILGHFDLIIVDECFTGDTLILTPYGEKRIDNMRAGDKVYCANGIGEVKATSSRPATDIYKVRFSDGKSIKCTGNHRLFTNSGWIEASRLDIGTVVYDIEAVRSLWENFLPSSLDSQGRNRKGNERESVEQAIMLLSVLCEEIEESNDETRIKGKDAKKTTTNRSQAYQAWRERAIASLASACIIARTGGWVECGTSNTNGIQSANGEGSLPDQLQNRHRKQGKEDRNRDRRGESYDSGKEVARPKESGTAHEVRVVGISHIKCESITPVYNLHVSEHPSYFANGKLVHNCHLIPKDGEGRYLKLISDLTEINPDIRVVGFTATPYRLDSGDICGPGNILTEVCYEQNVKSLIMRGFLSPIVSKAAVEQINPADWDIVRGEYNQEQANDSFEALPTIRAAVREIVSYTRDRKSVLIFCQSILHAQLVSQHLTGELATQILLAQSVLDQACGDEWGDNLDLDTDFDRLPVIADWLQDKTISTEPLRWWIANRDKPQDVATIYGDTPDNERATTIRRFRDGSIKYLVNVNVLTIGFDAPGVDCVVLLRATASPGLYYQMVGRGFRISPDKKNTLILDFGTNIQRHGPVDNVKKPMLKKGNKGGDDLGKLCPHCRCVMTTDQRICPECGMQMPADPQETKHNRTADDSDPLSGEAKDEWRDVIKVTYKEHKKKGAADTAPRTMRVTYQLSYTEYQSEWICVEHIGFAHDKARGWWRKRCYVPMPDRAFEAAMIAEHGLIAEPHRIKIKTKPGEKWGEIADYEIKPIPTERAGCPTCNNPREMVIDQSGEIICGYCRHSHGHATVDQIERYGIYQVTGKVIEVPAPIIPCVTEPTETESITIPNIDTSDCPF